MHSLMTRPAEYDTIVDMIRSSLRLPFCFQSVGMKVMRKLFLPDNTFAAQRASGVLARTSVTFSHIRESHLLLLMVEVV